MSSSTYQSRPDDLRLGDILQTVDNEDLQDDCDDDSHDKDVVVSCLTYEVDVGVARNGGRPGARYGPSCIHRYLPKLGSLHPPNSTLSLSHVKLEWQRIVQQQEVDNDNDNVLSQYHAKLSKAVTCTLRRQAFPICVGGGNDQSYANWKGLVDYYQTKQYPQQQQQQQQQENATKTRRRRMIDLHVVNIDAHLDVRPLPSNGRATSGTPFRQVLVQDVDYRNNQQDHSTLPIVHSRLTEFAGQPSQCSRDHANFVQHHNGTIWWLDQVQNEGVVQTFKRVLESKPTTTNNNMDYDETVIFVSFDLDSIKASDCPGVSCPSSIGLSAQDALDIMLLAGQYPQVRLLDISECNPLVEDYLTPRLVGYMMYHFLLGYVQRLQRRNQWPTPIPASMPPHVNKSYRLRISQIDQLVCVADIHKQGYLTQVDRNNLSIIENGTLLVDETGCLAYVGPTDRAPEIDVSCIDIELDGKGCAVIPGLCDAHTHTIWAGNRVAEFGQKLNGATYMDIHQSGGGIYSTVNATQQATKEELYQRLVQRLERMNQCGTTLVECKSGYGLDTDTEWKMMQVLDRAQQMVQSIDLVGNFCGAHAIPQGLTEEEAVTRVLNDMIPLIQREQEKGNLTSIKLCDVFVEDGVFSAASAERILQAAADIGLLGNFHGDELSCQSSGELAGKLGPKCRAVSHLEHVSDKGIQAMKDCGTAAVLLPTTSFVLRIEPPPARKLVEAGVPIALGTDFNPNAHCLSMPQAMFLACVTMKLSLEEALVASTLNAAYSMGMEVTHGSLEVGKKGDFVVIDAPQWENIVYQFGANPPIAAVVKDGIPIKLST